MPRATQSQGIHSASAAAGPTQNFQLPRRSQRRAASMAPKSHALFVLASSANPVSNPNATDHSHRPVAMNRSNASTAHRQRSP